MLASIYSFVARILIEFFSIFASVISITFHSSLSSGNSLVMRIRVISISTWIGRILFAEFSFIFVIGFTLHLA